MSPAPLEQALSFFQSLRVPQGKALQGAGSTAVGKRAEGRALPCAEPSRAGRTMLRGWRGPGGAGQRPPPLPGPGPGSPGLGLPWSSRCEAAWVTQRRCETRRGRPPRDAAARSGAAAAGSGCQPFAERPWKRRMTKEAGFLNRLRKKPAILRCGIVDGARQTTNKLVCCSDYFSANNLPAMFAESPPSICRAPQQKGLGENMLRWKELRWFKSNRVKVKIFTSRNREKMCIDFNLGLRPLSMLRHYKEIPFLSVAYSLLKMSHLLLLSSLIHDTF